MKYRISHIIAIFWALVFLFAFIQFYLKPIDVKALDASHISIKKPVFTINSWSEGSFQDTIKQRHNVNFPFRNDFVRLHNQIEYSLFENIAVNDEKDVVYSFDDILIYPDNVNAYLGHINMDEKDLSQKIDRLKVVQDQLKEDSIDFVYIIAPNKADFFADLIDYNDRFVKSEQARIYPRLKDQLLRKGIHIIDFQDWFMSLNLAKSSELFTPSSSHWSLYSVALATDSLLHYMYQKGYVDQKVIERVEYLSDTIIYPDNDLEQLMNLAIEKDYKGLRYFKRKENHPIIPLEFVTIGDSYWWQIWKQNCLGGGISPNHHFMFYGEKVYHNKGEENIGNWVSKEDKKSMINNSKIIFCIATEHTTERVINKFLEITEYSLADGI